MAAQIANATSSIASNIPIIPSYRIPTSPYDQRPRPSSDQLVFAVQPTGYKPSRKIKDGSWVATLAQAAPLSAPTPHPLAKRQVVIEVQLVTVIAVVPKEPSPNPSPVAITVTVPPPTNTMVSQGGWPIINPGSAAACWSDMACNSVCPNFQQNGWYAHCMDAACTKCRCQILSDSMCYGPPWTNATWISNAPARFIPINPAVSTVTVVAAQAGPSLFPQMDRRTRRMGVLLAAFCLAGWLAL